MRGRKPAPTTLKVLRGTRRDRINRNEPKPKSALPSCPSHLDAEARAEWRRVAPRLKELGLLTHLDRACLAAYCVAWSRLARAVKELAKDGYVVRAPSGYPISSPYVAIANTAAKQVREFAAEFGMTPSSRTRLKVENPDPPFDAFSELQERGRRD